MEQSRIAVFARAVAPALSFATLSADMVVVREVEVIA